VQASPETLMEPDEAVTLITASRRYQIAARDLRLGMFVAELDRPWLDTPFLLQGFLADSEIELDTLRKYCTYVYVDLEMSNPEVTDEIRRAEVRGAPAPAGDGRDGSSAGGPSVDPKVALVPKEPERAAAPSAAVPARTRDAAPRVYRARSDVRISSDTRQRFRQFVRATAAPPRGPEDDEDGLLGRAVGWLRRRVAGAEPARRAPAAGRERASRDAIRAWLPSDLELVDYGQPHGIEHELPRARSSYSRSEDVLRAIVTDVKVGKVPQVAEVASAVDEMVSSMIDNPDALLWVGRLRDEDVNTYNHGVKVALYLIALGRQIGFPRKELNELGLVGMLADVGKIKLPRALLDKPGMLAPSEYGLIKEHVRLGLEAMREAGCLPVAVEQGIAQHHERLDGSGYPKGLKGNEISLYGRMAAIADCFAALITPRAYANPSAPQDALMSLYEWAGTSFHEPLVEQFVQAVGVFPVGSLVELSSGEVAIVVAHNRVRRLEPRVLVLTWPDKSALSRPVERDLLTQVGAGNARLRIVRGLPAGAYGLKLRDYYMGEIARADEPAG
jgi:HD-GYP domain-containing protein (c-di-GMP phosphodiesterase class II)